MKTSRSHGGATPRVAQQAPLPIRILFAIAGALFPARTAGLVFQRMLRPGARRYWRESETLVGARRVQIPHGDSWVNAYLWGDGGPLAILLHGWESGSGDMDAFVAPLRLRGFRVLALDAPAHGESPGKQTDVHDMAEALAAALRDYGPAHSIIAHSLGAAAAAVCVDRHKDLPQRLVLLAPGGELVEELQRVAMALGLPQRALLALREHARRHYRQPLERCSTWRALTGSPVPTLVVHDRSDAVVAFADGERVARQPIDGRLLATRGLGHRRLLRDLDVIEHVVGFCAGHPAWQTAAGG